MKKRLTITVALAALFLQSTAMVRAFPPAPHHLLFGQVRDELGNPLTGTGELRLESGTGDLLTRVLLRDDLPGGGNYEMKVPMDSGMSGTAYKPTALMPASPFRIRVRLGGVDYLPIEMRGDVTRMGQPGLRTRLDLTLGEDSDRDGLPDAWERALIAAGKGNSLEDIRPDQDSDGDGLKNRDEYVAGTYAHDAANGFALTVDGFREGNPLLSFTAVRGRSYSLQGSANLESWENITFRSETDGDWEEIRTAVDTRPLQIEAELSGRAEVKFFRLMVR